MKSIKPNFLTDNIYEIEIDFYKHFNIKYIFADLDNTLDSYLLKVPSTKTIELVKKLKANNISLVIVSNNSEKRVSKYAKILKVSYISRAFKPFTFKIRKYMKKNHISPDETIFIGDQLLTDIKCANYLGIKSVYSKEIVSSNAFVTRLNKKRELKYKKVLKNSKICQNRRDVYVNFKES